MNFARKNREHALTCGVHFFHLKIYWNVVIAYALSLLKKLYFINQTKIFEGIKVKVV